MYINFPRKSSFSDMMYIFIKMYLKMIGLFCKRALQKRRYSAKETYNFQEPTNRKKALYACGIGMGWLRLVGSLKL